MNHGNKKNNLSRTASHRKAMLSNLSCQLITYKRITTTLAKAKALRTFIEPIITKTKNNDTAATIQHNHRIVFSYLNDKAAVKELFTVVGPKVSSRPGGYTRIIKLGARVGDAAELAMIELVDFNEIYGKGIGTETETTKKTRRSRSKKATGAAGANAENNEAAAVETTEAATVEGTEAAAEVAPSATDTEIASTENTGETATEEKA